MKSHEPYCHSLAQEFWCDHKGPGDFMGHTCKPPRSPTRKSLTPLTFTDAIMAGLERNKHWGGLEHWSLADWGNATAGECGEMCNAIKKARRIQLGMANKSDHPLVERHMALAKVRQEVMDTITYALHVYVEAEGKDFDADFRKVFNDVSDRYSFPVKL